MFPNILVLVNFAPFVYLAFVFLAAVFGMFLFWRAGRHELIESDFLLDTVVICSLGAFLFGRVFDFVVRPSLYQWSVERLIFFNVWPGLDLWGALFGMIFLAAFFWRNKKPGFWSIFDLAAAPLALSIGVAFLGLVLKDVLLGRVFSLNLYDFFAYFVLFWILVRLGKLKRHTGFFACFFLIAISSVALFLNFLRGFLGQSQVNEVIVFWGVVSYSRFAPGTFLFFGVVSWYILAKRDLYLDFKGFLGLALLLILKTKRIVSNVAEADNLARSIVLSPYYLAKTLYFLVKLIGREITLGIFDLMQTLGIKR